MTIPDVPLKRFLIVLLLLGLRNAAAETASDYPTRPVRLVVPFAAGGSSDIQARLIAQKLIERWRVPVIVDNRPGAGGIAASEVVASASADGHTLLLGHIGTHAFNPALYPSLPYDCERDFAAVTMTLTQPLVIVVAPGSPLTSVRSLIHAARSVKAPSYASAGVGSPNHVAAELFASMSRSSMVHVPYKGSAPAELDTIAGRVDLFFDTMLAAMPLIRSKRLRPLAVTSAQRSNSLPEVPTVAEAGIARYEIQTWNGVFVPAGTAPPIVQVLNSAIIEILNLPDVKARLEHDGAQLVGYSSAHFESFVRAERLKWGNVIRKAKIQAQ